MNTEKKLNKSIERLIEQQDQILSRKDLFLRGLVYGLGFFVGGTFLAGIFILTLSFFDTAPIIGEYIESIIEFIEAK